MSETYMAVWGKINHLLACQAKHISGVLIVLVAYNYDDKDMLYPNIHQIEK